MKLRIGTKLLLSFLATLVMTAAIGVISITQIKTIDDADTMMYERSVVALQELIVVNENLNRMQWRLRDLMLTEDEKLNAQYKSELTQMQAEVAKALETLPQTVFTDKGRQTLSPFTDAYATYKPHFEAMMALALQNKNAEALRMLQSTDSAFQKTLQALGVFTDYKTKQGEEIEKSNTEIANRAVFLVVALLLAVLGVSLTLALLMARSISGPIGVACDFAGAIAKGDLTLTVPPRLLGRGDEIGTLAHAFDEMIGGLTSVARNIQSASQSVAAGSRQISSTAQQMSQGATEQAASAEEVSSSVEEMAATIKQNTDNSLATEAISTRTAQDADAGGSSVEESVASMGEIAGKIGIIGEIARQTNLLALNAAIEAARAGDAGRGFAVVAGEVRKLAERSQKAAAEITLLSTETVDKASRAGELIKKVVPDIRKTAELVQEIASASREQSAGADQIGKAMVQLDNVVQQNASASEELASMAEELSGQSDQLEQAISFFKIGDAGTARVKSLRHGEKEHASADKASASKTASKEGPAAKEKTSGKAASKAAPKREAESKAPPRTTAITLAPTDSTDDEFEQF